MPNLLNLTHTTGGGLLCVSVSSKPRDGIPALPYDSQPISFSTTSFGSESARMTLEHTAIIEDHWNQFGPGAVGIGWDLALMGLAQHLATGAPADHAAAEAWMGSPNGKEFMSQSGEFWRAAHVASGVDPASAKERSDQTIAFYRGEIPPDMAHPGTGS